MCLVSVLFCLAVSCSVVAIQSSPASAAHPYTLISSFSLKLNFSCSSDLKLESLVTFLLLLANELTNDALYVYNKVFYCIFFVWFGLTFIYTYVHTHPTTTTKSQANLDCGSSGFLKIESSKCSPRPPNVFSRNGGSIVGLVRTP